MKYQKRAIFTQFVGIALLLVSYIILQFLPEPYFWQMDVVAQSIAVALIVICVSSLLIGVCLLAMGSIDLFLSIKEGKTDANY